MVYGTYQVLEWKDTTGDYQSSFQQLYATEDDLMDVVFMGSSHCYAGINPTILWDEYGISAFDMAVSGQDKDSTYYMLKELLKTQSPEVVFVDAYGLLFDEHDVLGNLYRNMLTMDVSNNSNELIRTVVDEEDQGDFLLRWPIIHTRYRELEKYDFIQNPYSVYGRGQFLTWHTEQAYIPKWVGYDIVGELSAKNQMWIDNLVALSYENDFRLVMYMAPCAYSEERRQILNVAKLYLEECGVDLIDFNVLFDEVGLVDSTDFSDSFHLNVLGATKVTEYIANYLVSAFELEDHRADENYYLWEQDYEYFIHRSLENEFSVATEFDEYANLILNNNDLVTILSLDGGYKESTLDYISILDVFEIDSDEIDKGGKWIIEDGSITKIMDGDSEEKYILELNKYETLCVKNVYVDYKDTKQFDVIQINGESYGSLFSGLSIVVYDRVLEKVVLKTGLF